MHTTREPVGNMGMAEDLWRQWGRRDEQRRGRNVFWVRLNFDVLVGVALHGVLGDDRMADEAGSGSGCIDRQLHGRAS